MKMKRFLLVVAPMLLLSGSLNSCGVQDYYTVTFETEGGSKVASINLPIFEVYEKGSTVKKANLDKPSTDPTKDNCDFVCWSSDGLNDFFADGSKVSITGDTTLYAVWDEWGTEVTFDKWKSGIENTYGSENNYTLKYYLDDYEKIGDVVCEYYNEDTVKRSGKNSVAQISGYVDGESSGSYEEYEKFDNDANAYYRYDFGEGLSFSVLNESWISNLIKGKSETGTGEIEDYGLVNLVKEEVFKKFEHTEGTNVTYSYYDEDNDKSYVLKFNKDYKLIYYSFIKNSGCQKEEGEDLYNSYRFYFTNYGKTEIADNEIPSAPGKITSKDRKSEEFLNPNQTYNCAFDVESNIKNYTISLVTSDDKTISNGFKERPRIYVDGVELNSITYDGSQSKVSFDVNLPASKILISCSTSNSSYQFKGGYLKLTPNTK